MKKCKINKKQLTKALIIILALLIVCIIVLFLNKGLRKEYYKYKLRAKYAETYKVEDAETYGWIQVQGTNIDYPVIDETEDAYTSGLDYLWRVNTYNDGDNREAIYGHNILNVSSKPLINNENHTRFEQLMGFVYEDFAKENLYIDYSQNGEEQIYKIYAVGFVSKDEENGESYTNDDLIDTYIKKAKANSLYDYDVDVNHNDHIISLITCTRYFGLNGKTQFRVDARKLRKGEKISKYKVKITSNYDSIHEENDNNE